MATALCGAVVGCACVGNWKTLVVRSCVALAVAGCATAPKRDVSALVELTGDAIIVRETIQFEHGSATILERSTDLLDAVARIMLETDAITLLTIVGHTDSTGDPAANQPLSLARAEAVKRYLVEKGVAAARLSAVGHGDGDPLGSNATEEGRALNRRVDFKVTR